MFNSIFGLFMAMLLLLLTSKARSELDSTLPINQNSTDSLFGKFSQCTTMLKQFFEVKLHLQEIIANPKISTWPLII